MKFALRKHRCFDPIDLFTSILQIDNFCTTVPFPYIRNIDLEISNPPGCKLNQGPIALAKVKTMKRTRGKANLLAGLAVAVGLSQLFGTVSSAQTCMTEDLFLYKEPQKPAPKSQPVKAPAKKKSAGAGIADLDAKNSFHQPKPSDERERDQRQKIAGRN